MTNLNKYIGSKYGKLTILSIGVKQMATCLCECGNTSTTRLYHLFTGNTSSCGCERKRVTGARARRHGKSGASIYNIWCNMIDRCYNETNKNYYRYGGRGIKMSEMWRNSFQTFHDDVGDRPSSKHTIDRIDNDKGYSKENCRWATWREQQLNKRSTRLVDYNGTKMPLTKVAEITGLTFNFLSDRLRFGWSLDEAIKHPAGARLKTIRNAEYIKSARERAEKLRIQRIELGIEIRSVELATGIPNAYISKLELGKYKLPSLERLEKLESYYQSLLRANGLQPETNYLLIKKIP